MNKGQFPESNKTISGIDLPKTDQDDVQYVGFAAILSNCETTDNTIRLFKREFKHKSKLNQVTSKFALIKSMSNMQKHN